MTDNAREASDLRQGLQIMLRVQREKNYRTAARMGMTLVIRRAQARPLQPRVRHIRRSPFARHPQGAKRRGTGRRAPLR